MKSLMVTVCVLALSAFGTLPAAAKLGLFPTVIQTEHEYTSVGGTDSVETFIDYPTLERDGDTIKVWTLWVYYPGSGADKDQPAFSLESASIDCKARTSGFTQFIEYGLDGSMLTNADGPPSGVTGTVVPGSMGEQVLNAACAGEYASGKAFDSMPDAVTAGRFALAVKGVLAKQE